MGGRRDEAERGVPGAETGEVDVRWARAEAPERNEAYSVRRRSFLGRNLSGVW